MPRATCRCGQILNVPEGESDRTVCPQCGARVRIRRSGQETTTADGYLRFFCPCGRRLKVQADRPPSHGKCPDCGRVVPVPAQSSGKPGNPLARTDELTSSQREQLQRWEHEHRVRSDNGPSTADLPGDQATAANRAEAGLRVCPGCQRPVHLGADVCTHCGTPVPRR